MRTPASQGHSTARPWEERNGRSMAWTWHGMTCVNRTAPHCVNQMGKTYSKPLAAWHGRGRAWARHGNGMLCVNRPSVSQLVGSLWGDHSSNKNDHESLKPFTNVHIRSEYHTQWQRISVAHGLRTGQLRIRCWIPDSEKRFSSSASSE
jgi:hypothetical protein